MTEDELFEACDLAGGVYLTADDCIEMERDYARAVAVTEEVEKSFAALADSLEDLVKDLRNLNLPEIPALHHLIESCADSHKDRAAKTQKLYNDLMGNKNA